MITEKDTIKCEAIFNDDRTHRLSWKRVWGKDKPLCTVIMLNPSLSDNIMTDTTTTLVVNNIARLEKFGGVVIVNLYSLLTNKLNFRWNSDEDLIDEETDSYLIRAAEECDSIIIAWGKAGENHPRIMNRAKAVLDLLSPYKEKFLFISDGKRNGLHPLTPTIRSEIQEVCDQIIIIHRGKMLANGSTAELETSLGSSTIDLTVKAESDEEVRSMLTGIEGLVGIKSRPSKNGEISVTLKLRRGVDVREAIFNAAVKSGHVLLKLNQSEMNLENIFLEITQGEANKKKKGSKAKENAEV